MLRHGPARSRCLFAVLAALVAGVALAGRAQAQTASPPPGLPAWCAAAGISGQTETAGSAIEDEAKRAGHYGTSAVARTIARAACAWRSTPADDQKVRDKAAAGRARFKAATGLADAEVDELFALVVDNAAADREAQAYCKAVAFDPRAATAREGGAAVARQYVVCDRTRGSDGIHDWPDRSEVDKVVTVHACMKALQEVGAQLAGMPWQMLQFARCNTLATRLDDAAYLAEIAADARFNRYATLWAKALLFDARARTAVVQEVYRALAQKGGAAYQALLFTAPEAAYAAFLAQYAADRAFFDDAQAVIDAGGPLASLKPRFAGCGARFAKVLTGVLAGQHPATPADAYELLREPRAYFAAMAFTKCEAIDDRVLVALVYADALRGAPVPRGPMAAAQVASLRVLLEHASEIRGARELKAPPLGATPGLGVVPPATVGVEGVIAQVAPAGEGAVKVTFKKVTWDEAILECVETNRIDRIEPDGTIRYRQACKAVGTRKRERTEAPIVVEQRFAGALTAGRFVSARATTDAVRSAVPLAVWADAKQQKLLGVLGFTF